MDDRLCFRQLLAGRDFAGRDPIAGQMANFTYLIGDRERGQCMLVDPAWHVADLLRLCEDDGLELTGVLCTHHHPDHVGGDMFGHVIEGVAELVKQTAAKAHIHQLDAEGLRRVTGLADTSLVTHQDGDRVAIGELEIEVVHTPGHTPGSLCFLVDGRLLSGDTLFVDGCGRVDLPGGDPDEMFRSLTERLARFADDTAVYPGHDYGGRPTSTLGEERRHNTYLQVASLEDWRRMMGGGVGSGL